MDSRIKQILKSIEQQRFFIQKYLYF